MLIKKDGQMDWKPQSRMNENDENNDEGDNEDNYEDEDDALWEQIIDRYSTEIKKYLKDAMKKCGQEYNAKAHKKMSKSQLTDAFLNIFDDLFEYF